MDTPEGVFEGKNEILYLFSLFLLLNIHLSSQNISLGDGLQTPQSYTITNTTKYILRSEVPPQCFQHFVFKRLCVVLCGCKRPWRSGRIQAEGDIEWGIQKDTWAQEGEIKMGGGGGIANLGPSRYQILFGLSHQGG